MTRRGRVLLIVIVVVQVLVIIAMATGRERTLRGDEDVTLQTRPVDPRDLFRGDYVVLDYEIATIETNRADRPFLEPGDTVFVELVPRGDTWIAGRVAWQPFDGVEEMIRGTVVRAGTETVQVEYGIEQYFVPEGRGQVVERAADVDVVVAIDGDGGAVIRHLVVDGEVWDPYE
jgi:uncharacterized membrane-anchored protein